VRGVLVLEDGRSFTGDVCGATGQGAVLGEVVFNTGMTGYQEVLTDPSYAGQIVVMTYPLIGNYGVRDADAESARPHVRGFVVADACAEPSHWAAEGDVAGYLRQHGIIALTGVDTRALTKHLRTKGTLRGAIAPLPADPGAAERLLAELAAAAEAWQPGNLVAEVTTPEPYVLNPDGQVHVVVVDFGVKRNILRSLVALGCRVTVVPADTTAAAVLALRPDGVVLSNGPGDPELVPGARELVSGLLEANVPLFGICLGHQLLALALGGRTRRMKFGHHGVNHPVRESASGRAFITTQNHEFAVTDLDPRLAEVTHVNLNDGTVEGLRVIGKPAFSVQFHPEACPGPGDTATLFREFLSQLPVAAR
jgi:carbamoyl-phosphate synthase small subunit